MKRLTIAGTARASFYLYNEEREIDVLVEALKNVRKIFGAPAVKS
jgi:cysteine desulfurase/selenocysteine lyase